MYFFMTSPSAVILIVNVLSLTLCQFCESSTTEQTQIHADVVGQEREMKSSGEDHRAEHFDKDEEIDEEFDHEAIIGSKLESEEYKALEPEEAKQRLRELVVKMDVNKNGTIEHSELEHWILHSFKTLDQERSNQLFETKDEDKNGFLQWEEILHRVFGYKQNELKQLENDTSPDTKDFLRIIAEDELKFQHADVNRDGKLDKTEYAAYYSPQYYPHMSPLEAYNVLHRLDSDNDGFLVQDEFLTKHAKSDNKTFEREHEMKMFKKYDVNNDGKLDKLELVNWITEGTIENAKLEVGHLFRETDANKDGLLTPEEIVNQSDLWVGSQVTDYGIHLTRMDGKSEL